MTAPVTTQDIVRRLRSILAEDFDIDLRTGADQSADEMQDLDSMDLLELITIAQEEYGVELRDEQLRDVADLGDLAFYIVQASSGS
jgi:acyl carrier protein